MRPCLRRTPSFSLSVWLALSALPAAGQDFGFETGSDSLYLVPRIDSPIVLDGRLDDPAWQSIEPLPVVMMLPEFGEMPSERTEFRIAHDGEYLYFSCAAYDSQPDEIRALSLRRGESGFTSDRCAILLDTANDGENALGFFTSPAGVRSEYHYSQDGRSINQDWSTFWEVVSSQDQQGWYGEFRIPLSSLFFQVEDGRTVMAVSMMRNIARKQEMVTHPAFPPRFSQGWRMVSQMRKIVFEGLERENPIYVTPYSLLGGGYSHAPNQADGTYDRNSNEVLETGLDVKYNLASNLTLDITANTDFAQVEADDQQVNLSRFNLFFPEKRRFFQERVSNFEYSVGGQERLFHSRRVGLVDGEPVRIYGGVRLVGRVGEWDLGLLNMQTAESDFLPSENQGVFRLRRRVLNANSYVGGLLTNRMASGGGRNLVYGLDGIFRVAELDYVTLNWSQSFDTDEALARGGPIDLFDRSLLRLNWERRVDDGLNYVLDLSRVGEVFEPKMGFLRRRDFLKGEAGVGYGWRPAADSRLLRYGMNLETAVFRRNEDGAVETGEVRATAVVETRGRHQWTLTVPGLYENLAQGFDLPRGSMVPAGIYRFAQARLQYRPPASQLFQPRITMEGGRFYDGNQISLTIGPTWNVSRHLTLTGSYGVDHVVFPDRDQEFTAHIGTFRSEVLFTTATSIIGFVQYNSIQDIVTANVRLRYNPREGNDLYLVWNEGLITDRRGFTSARPFTDQRTILLKYSHTLQFGL